MTPFFLFSLMVMNGWLAAVAGGALGFERLAILPAIDS
jgi:hypothetical protein